MAEVWGLDSRVLRLVNITSLVHVCNYIMGGAGVRQKLFGFSIDYSSEVSDLRVRCRTHFDSVANLNSNINHVGFWGFGVLRFVQAGWVTILTMPICTTVKKNFSTLYSTLQPG